MASIRIQVEIGDREYEVVRHLREYELSWSHVQLTDDIRREFDQSIAEIRAAVKELAE